MPVVISQKYFLVYSIFQHNETNEQKHRKKIYGKI